MLLTMVGYTAEMLLATGGIRSLDPHFLGECTAVAGIIGPEDLTIHPGTGIAYVSAYDRRADARGIPIRGGIYAYRPGTGALVELTRDLPGDFRPHGIGLWVNPARAAWLAQTPGRRRGAEPRDSLFVVNHAQRRHRVDIFDITDDRLLLRGSVEHPLLVSPSDVLAVGPSAFYATNDTGTRVGNLSWYLENFGRYPFSNVVYYDGSGMREVASHIAKASGINWSTDRKQVYVAALMGGRIHVYDRSPETGDLTKRMHLELGTNPDSIEIDTDGSLIIGAHPELSRLILHVVFGPELEQLAAARAPTLPDLYSGAPSQVLRVRLLENNQFLLHELYLDTGEQLAASTVASRQRERLLIGSLTDSHLLDCRLDPYPTFDLRGALNPT
jgi:arylesterase/paraoxonase